jgi:hypothetical protein
MDLRASGLVRSMRDYGPGADGQAVFDPFTVDLFHVPSTHPPKSSMPYLVVTVSPDGVDVTAQNSRVKKDAPSRRRLRAFLVSAAIDRGLRCQVNVEA